jgi:hypothetical protein
VICPATLPFLETLVGDSVKVVPDIGRRRHIGKLTAVEGTPENPVLVVHVSQGNDVRTPWSAIDRLMVGQVIPISPGGKR